MVLSLRLVSVLICVVLTLVTAVLTLSVSLSFSKQAVTNIGHQYATSLASNLNTELQSILQSEVNQYFGVAASFVQEPTTLPNATHWQWWNGSYWAFNNHSELDFLRGYERELMQIQMSHNFSRELNSVMCFADGTFVRITTYDAGLPSQAWIPKGPNPYDSSIVQSSLIPGKPGGAPFNNTPAGYSYILTRNYYVVNGSAYTPVPISSEKVLHPAPWALPASQCDATYACVTIDCRQRPFFQVTRTLKPRQCAWYPLFIPQRATIATGVSCAIYNSLGQWLGATASVATLELLSRVVQTTKRTARSQAFIVNVADDTILGSTYPEAFSSFWRYGNATYVAARGVLVNNSLNPITVPAGFDGASFMNATYLVPKKLCLVGTTSTALFIGCQKTIDMYGYEPLRTLRHGVGLNSATAQRGTILSGGESYFYATELLVTYADNQVVPGLRWTSIILTPESEVMGEVAKGRSYSIVASASFFVFAAVCCFLLFAVLLKPLERLENQMEATAKLADDDDVDESLSAVSEVHNMQASFYKLRGQLRKLKSFVPQSVLATLQQSADVDEEDEEVMMIVSVRSENEVGRAPSTLSSSQNFRKYELPAALASAPSGKDFQATAASSTNLSDTNGRRQSVASNRLRDPASARLNLSLGLTKRTISVLVFNAVGLHAFMKEASSEALLQMHSKLLEAFSSSVARGKGVVDSFQGDRFVATFNAVTANVQHAARAAGAAAELVAAFQRVRGSLSRATIGIATGDAQVGNAGTDTLRRFCTIGRVYTQATVMERLAKQNPSADVVLTPTTAASVAHLFSVEALDCIVLEGASRPVVIYALRTRKTHAVEEWNYAMAAAESQDEFLKPTEAWIKYAEGDSVAASGLLLSCPESSRQRPGAERLLGLLNRDVCVDAYTAANQGYFYQTSFAETQQCTL